MYKAKQRFTTLLLACFAVLVSMLLAITLWTLPTNTASAADPTLAATFALGANGSASHNDGSSQSAYTETVDGYTLSITDGTNMYTGARDAKGNSCLKLGASSKAASFNFTVPSDIVEVVIHIGKYKANTTKISINNGTTQTLTKSSNDGEYDAITVDTSSTKTITLNTLSGGYRAMVNTIEFYKAASACEHPNQTTTTVEATCTTTGSITTTCNDCGETVSTETIAATGHTSDIILDAKAPTCTDTGLTEGKQCSVCGATTQAQETVDALGHDFADPVFVREGDQHTATGTCTVCGETTSTTEDCTLTIDGYETLETDDKEAQQHAVTTTCSVCEQTETVNEACSFDEGVLDGATLTYTCEHCAYSYDEEVTTYTVTYVVPDTVTSIEAVTVAAGFETTLPTAEAPDTYTFVGWTTVNLGQETKDAPDYETAGTQYTVDADITFYALYSYVEESSTWTIVKDVNSLSVNKEIVIVASDSDYALGADKGNNRNAASITKSGDTVTINTDVQIITLEAGTVTNTFAFNVGNGYLCAASSSSNYLKTKDSIDDNGSWLITIAQDGVATIKAQGTYTRNWLRTNSSSELFSCYSSGQNDVSIYMKGSETYYVTASNTCEHANLNEQSQEATCTEQGYRKVTCLDCGTILIDEEFSATGHTEADSVILEATCSAVGSKNIVCSVCEEILEEGVEIPKVPHTYENGKCTACGERLPLEATLTFDDKETKRTSFSTEQQVWTENSVIFTNDKAESTTNIGDYANPVRFYKSSTITIAYPNMVKIIFVCNTAAYASNLQASIGDSASADDKTVTVILAEVSNSFTITLGAQVRMDSLTVISAPSINTASVTLNEDITLNYYVSIPESIKDDVELVFTMNGNSVDAIRELQGNRYKFSLELPPQYMTDTVQAELHYNGLLLDKIENYSIQAYANSILSQTEDANLKRLISNMLHYGAAAQQFKGYNLENLANENVDGIFAATEDVPTSTDFTLEKNTEINSYPAYFTGAGVHFDNVNQIYVKLSTTENVTLTMDGNAVEINGTTVYTGGITVTDFATTHTFVLSHNGVVMQTLTYSINAYAYQMQSNEDMKALVSALYRYGTSATAYVDSLNA